MKFIALFICGLAFALQSYAYLPVDANALNVRHFHVIQRGKSGGIVGRSFLSTYSLHERNDEDAALVARRDCTTIMACGTPGGCMSMAPQTYCKGVSWEKSFQDSVRQTGANGITALKIMAEGIGRGPVGMIVGASKATAKAIIKAEMNRKKNKKRSLGEDYLLSKRDFVVVERDGDMNLVARGEYSMYDLMERDENGSSSM